MKSLSNETVKAKTCYIYERDLASRSQARRASILDMPPLPEDSEYWFKDVTTSKAFLSYPQGLRDQFTSGTKYNAWIKTQLTPPDDEISPRRSRSSSKQRQKHKL